MSKKPYILHTEASCGWGGQEIRILEEARGFITLGYRVEIVCPRESRLYEESNAYHIPTHALPIARKTVKGFFALRRWIRQNPITILNTHSSTDTWLTVLACLTMRAPPPIVRTRHISAPIPQNWPSRWLYTKGVRYVATTGDSLKKQLLEQTNINPLHVTSVPTGIDPARFNPKNKNHAYDILSVDPHKKYIGIIATIRSWKGHAYLIKAFEQIKEEDWELLIIGEGPHLPEIKKEISRCRKRDKIKLVGHTERAEIWLKALHVFCLPSYANEGVPQAILQAMFTKVPVVSTTIGAIPEIIINEKTGLLVPPKDVDALKTALVRLINDKALGSKLAESAYRLALSKHSKKRMIKNMQQIFESVL